MTVTCKTKVDTSGYRKFKRQAESKVIQFGWINTPVHWANEKDSITVAEVARELHYNSPWGQENSDGSFMIDTTDKQTVQNITFKYLKFLGRNPLPLVQEAIGEAMANEIARRIIDTDSPPNSDAWAQEKGFNKPLEHGSRQAQSNSLLNQVSYKVVKK